MSKFFGKAYSRYQGVATSISLFPDDDFTDKFSHNTFMLEDKVMKKTAQQMKDALITYLIENPDVITELKYSSIYVSDKQLKLELDEQIESAKKYADGRQYKFAF